MSGLTEIRWHARAGQGAKTASQVLALALLRSGKSVQSFPEYGPERRGAPLRGGERDSALRAGGDPAAPASARLRVLWELAARLGRPVRQPRR